MCVCVCFCRVVICMVKLISNLLVTLKRYSINTVLDQSSLSMMESNESEAVILGGNQFNSGIEVW